MENSNLKKSLNELKNKWPSSIVARTDVKQFSGGALCPGTLANEDSRGTGPKGAFKIGKKKVYPVDSLIDYMAKHAA
jgi:hypothetical protein